MTRLPEEFHDIMEKKLGIHYPEFVASLDDATPISIRQNPQKKIYNGSDLRVPWSDLGIYLEIRPVFTLDPLFHAGTYYVQEASSMFLEQAIKQSVDLSRSLNVLDLCAAPGGKSTHILSLLNSKSLLVSNEVIRSRASILSENIQKWGYCNAAVTNNDPKEFQNLPGFFDAIVIDAPCSGEGLFRKDPEAIQEWSPQNVALCASRQKRIIADVWPALKENGILIYCTCTYNEAENEANLLWLQKEHDIEFVELTLDPNWGIEATSSNGVRGYRFFPHRLRGEGFFISVMRKTEKTAPFRAKIKKSLALASKKTSETLQHWIKSSKDSIFFLHEDLVYFLPFVKSADVAAIAQYLKIIHAGTAVATLKHEKLIPEHALALSIEINMKHFKSLSLGREDAIRYLRRDLLPAIEDEKGHYLVTFEGTSLGWVNNLGNRINNMYPQEWRIRMAQPH